MEEATTPLGLYQNAPPEASIPAPPPRRQRATSATSAPEQRPRPRSDIEGRRPVTQLASGRPGVRLRCDGPLADWDSARPRPSGARRPPRPSARVALGRRLPAPTGVPVTPAHTKQSIPSFLIRFFMASATLGGGNRVVGTRQPTREAAATTPAPAPDLASQAHHAHHRVPQMATAEANNRRRGANIAWGDR